MPKRLKRLQPPQDEINPLIPIMNLVCMLIPFLLLSAAFIQYAAINVQAPKIQSASQQQQQPDQMPLNLTVMVTNEGFHFKVNPQHRLPWMAMETDSASGAGPDIPKKPDGEYDYEQLTDKLKEIKEKHQDENQIIIGCEDNIKYEILIKVMDASRGTDESPLFKDVVLTRGIA